MEAGLWRGVAERVEEKGVDGIVSFLMPDMLTGETRMQSPAVTDYLSTVMKGATKEAAVGGAMALAQRPDYTETLDKIEVPTLVLVGLGRPGLRLRDLAGHEGRDRRQR